MKYPKEALEPENLVECIDGLSKKITDLESIVVNDESVGIFALKAQLEAVTELHLKALEEHTEQIGILIKMLDKPGKLSSWLARFGL